jgi:leucyl-tRNA synthetase
MEPYDAGKIESRWQAVWDDERTWEVPNPGDPGFDDSKPKNYVLEMLPYPSGEPHVGHLKCYAVGDAIAHFRRRNGFQVIHPMGYDAFGLPAENHAIRTGEPPRVSTEKSIRTFREQFRRWGVSIDWSREIATHEPDYYRWTQWIFLQMLERDLAYRAEAPVQWCPTDQTVLANEQVIDGRCERCGSEVVTKRLEQWFFRITEYADRLLSGSRRGPTTSSRCSTTGSADPRGRRPSSTATSSAWTFPSSRRAPTRSSAPPSSSSPPSTPRSRSSSTEATRPPPCAPTSTRRRAARPRSEAPRTARRPAWRSTAR